MSEEVKEEAIEDEGKKEITGLSGTLKQEETDTGRLLITANPREGDDSTIVTLRPNWGSSPKTHHNLFQQYLKKAAIKASLAEEREVTADQIKERLKEGETVSF